MTGLLRKYYLTILIVMLCSIGVNLAVSSFGYGQLALGLPDDFLRFSKGVAERDSALCESVFETLFPGYEDVLDKAGPPLNSEDEFALTTVLVGSDRKAHVYIPLELPFRLLEERTPDVLIFGTSRARDGINPKVLAQTLGVETVLNFAVSAASATTEELLMQQVKVMQRGKSKVVIICVDDSSFSVRSSDLKAWDAKIKSLSSKPSFLTSLKRTLEGAKKLVTHSREKWIVTEQDLSVLASCGNVESRKREEQFESSPKQRFPEGVSLEQMDALRRIADIAPQLAHQVVYLVMPLTEKYYTYVDGFNYLPRVRKIVGDDIIIASLPAFGLTDADFFGAKGRGNCEMDLHHLNPLGAVKFSKALAKRLKEAS
ncbi:hypothetical protein GM415_02255 [Pseudodesulfovibrio cashew]|uniref:SGNH/GDSL hydrolase family protein n=1 Tax=Pseudodesulfovibrio cashew TaxID=2678688 RepID=A0A6I6J850_9BACT|nr:hypothetical protein [Pseudodesulfovibrio cashew]QGY39006.1 hypothetical protein GM415_02255 [Pseudodesulfovibrio cashew]